MNWTRREKVTAGVMMSVMVIGSLVFLLASARQLAIRHFGPHPSPTVHAISARTMLLGERMIQTEQASVLEKQKEVLEKSKILSAQFAGGSDSTHQTIASK